MIEAEDAEGALDALGRSREISLLFTDVALPGGMDGYQLAAEAVRRRPEIKVLYTSAHGRGSVGGGSGKEPRPLLKKPYRDHELARAVHEALH